MIESIVVSALTLVGTIITVISGNKLMAYRISELEKKVDKHNNLIERTYALEKKVELLENELQHIEE